MARNSIHEINLVKQSLGSKSKIKYLGSLRYFLGFEIDRTNLNIFFNQRQYTLELLQDTGNLVSQTFATPFDQSLKLSISDGTPLADPTIYRRLLG